MSWERIVFGWISFLGINCIYFYFASVFKWQIRSEIILFVQLGWWFIGRIGKSKRIKMKSAGNGMVFTVVLLVAVLAWINIRSFNNGWRLPIPSFTQDAANNYSLIYGIIDNDRIERSDYPLGLQANTAWWVEELSNIVGRENDVVVGINLMVIFFWIIEASILVMMAMTASKLAGMKGNKVVAWLTLMFGSGLSLMYLSYGFYSSWFNQLFLLGLIYLIAEDRMHEWNMVIPILGGYFYSYAYFMPILVLYFCYRIVFKGNLRDWGYGLAAVGLTLLFGLTLTKTYGVDYVATTAGHYAFFPMVEGVEVLVFGLYFITVKRNKLKGRGDLNILIAAFLLVPVLLGVYQVVKTSFLQYSFYKYFGNVYALLTLVAVAGMAVMVRKYLQNKNVIKENISLVIAGLGLALLMIYRYNALDFYLSMTMGGKFNFFGNINERYNAVVYAMENLDEYNNAIYIDGDFQSTRWATIGLLPRKFKVFSAKYEELTDDRKSLDYYISVIKEVDEKTIVLNPSRYLEAKCLEEVDELIGEIDKNDLVRIYPEFNKAVHQQNCYGR